MNAGVALVEAYLHLNGYFTQAEIPVVRGTAKGYHELTDLDVLAVRFPGAASVIPRGRPGPEDDLLLEGDPLLGVSDDALDVVIAEVKEGKARINEGLRTREALRTALLRVGAVAEDRLDDLVERLRREGTVRLEAASAAGLPLRVRLLAFGEGTSGKRNGYTVVSMKQVARFVDDFLDRHHDVLTPAAIGDPVLGLLHLLRKLT